MFYGNLEIRVVLEINMTKKLTIIELAKDIGKKGIWTFKSRSGGEMRVEVEIKNVEIAYGSGHYTIAPVAGEGQIRVRTGLQIK